MNTKKAQVLFESFIEELLESEISKANGKRIIVFGAGRNLDYLLKIKDFLDLNTVIVDNDKLLQGTSKYGQIIRNPDVIKSFSQGKFIVYVTAGAMEIHEQLANEFSLEPEVDFVNLSRIINTKYSLFYRYNNIMSYLKPFVAGIPSDYFDETAKESKEKLAVVLNLEMLRFPYPFVLFLIFARKRFNVDLIIDDSFVFAYLNCDSHKEAGRLISCDFRAFTEDLCNRFPNITIKYIDAISAEMAFGEEDEHWMKKNSDDAVLSVRGYSGARLINDNMLSKSFEQAYRHYYNRLSVYFGHNKYSILVTFSDPWVFAPCLYRIGEKNKIRVATFENGRGQIKMFYNSDGAATHMCDIRHVLNNNMIPAEKLTELTDIAKIAFRKFKDIVCTPEEIVDAHVPYAELSYLPKRMAVTETYDVVMPLNVLYDGAALHFEGCFESQKEWIFSTVNFVLTETDANIIVRPHPADKWYKRVVTYENELNERFKSTGRFRYVGAEEDLNTHQLFEKAKLVLPWSNTAGIEAALIGRTVIMVIDAYYSIFPFVKKANTIDEYFKMIKEALATEVMTDSNELDKAYLCWYMVKNFEFDTAMSEDQGFANPEKSFLTKNIMDLETDDTIDTAVKILADGVPSPCMIPTIRALMENFNTNM